MSKSVWTQEVVSDSEWAEAVKEAEERIDEIEARRISNLQEDFADFYGGIQLQSALRELSLAKNKGVDSVYGLVDLGGQVVNAKIVEGKYGEVWLVKDENENVSWVNVSQAKDISRQQKHYEKFGYQIALVYYHFASGNSGFYADKKRGVVKVEVL
jgi:hypothetical protein